MRRVVIALLGSALVLGCAAMFLDRGNHLGDRGGSASTSNRAHPAPSANDTGRATTHTTPEFSVLHGRVRDAFGEQPGAPATVTIYAVPSGQQTHSLTTRATGEFEVQGLRTGHLYAVHAEVGDASQLQRAHALVIAGQGPADSTQPAVTSLEMLLHFVRGEGRGPVHNPLRDGPIGPIVGQLRDRATGAPLPDFEISWYGSFSTTTVQAHDPDGRFHFWPPNLYRQWYFSIHVEGYVGRMVVYSPATKTHTPYDFRLDRDIANIVVTDLGTLGKDQTTDVANAQIHFLPQAASERLVFDASLLSRCEFLGATDSNGRLSVPHPGRGTLIATHSDYQSGSCGIHRNALLEGTGEWLNPDSYEIRLNSLRLRTKVVDPAGQPIAGALIGFHPTLQETKCPPLDAEFLTTLENVVATDADGIAFVRHPDQHGWLVAHHTNFLPTASQLMPLSRYGDWNGSDGGSFFASGDPESFVLHPGATIVGSVVTQDGLGVANATVECRLPDDTEAIVTTARNGEFELTKLPAGDVDLNLIPPLRGYGGCKQTITVADDATHETTVRVPSRGDGRLSVQMATGQFTVQSAHLALIAHGEQEDGSRATWESAASRTGHSPTVRLNRVQPGLYSATATVVIAGGERRRWFHVRVHSGVLLQERVTFGQCRIFGHVDNGHSGMVIELYEDAIRSELLAGERADPDVFVCEGVTREGGAFSFDLLDDGDYTVVLRSGDTIRAAEVTIGENDDGSDRVMEVVIPLRATGE
ncbi:MAG: carboxypeptidase-like regulatory domain-containing protein [Planctomycetota bacterium]